MVLRRKPIIPFCGHISYLPSPLAEDTGRRHEEREERGCNLAKRRGANEGSVRLLGILVSICKTGLPKGEIVGWVVAVV